jgi:DNA-binding IclR family transcriptional regulator
VARRAPAIERCVAVLNHLAERPRESFTLSQIARELDLNKATAHSLLTTLVDAGYLVRHQRDKSYGLGPALIALGNASLTAYPAAQLAVGPMEELSD